MGRSHEPVNAFRAQLLSMSQEEARNERAANRHGRANVKGQMPKALLGSAKLTGGQVRHPDRIVGEFTTS